MQVFCFIPRFVLPRFTLDVVKNSQGEPLMDFVRGVNMRVGRDAFACVSGHIIYIHIY